MSKPDKGASNKRELPDTKRVHVATQDILGPPASYLYTPKKLPTWTLCSMQEAEEKTLAWISKFTAKFDEDRGSGKAHREGYRWIPFS